MQKNKLKCAVLLSAATAFIVAGTSPASTMDWLAERLRGDVYRVEDREWVPVSRGDVVPTGTIVWTTKNAFADFRSGENRVALTPETQVKFIERPAQDQNWVQLWFGEVDVDVEARDVNHFAVQTPYMVAVVKGTAFSVASDDEGAAVKVQRGSVAVRDTASNHNVTLGAGQSVSGGPARDLSVSGSGALPVVVDARGNPVITPPGHNNAPGNSGSAPGNSGNAPGKSGSAPGNSGNAPGNNGSAPGNSGSAPGNSGNTSASGNASTSSSNAGGSGGTGNSNASGSANTGSGNANGNADGQGKP